jgi:hypothetical protein
MAMAMADSDDGTQQQVTPTLYNVLLAKRKEQKLQFLALLSCTHAKESPAHILRGNPDLLKVIQSFAYNRAPPSEEDCHYQVKVDGLLSGTEHVHVEALHGQGGWYNMIEDNDDNQKLCGVLSDVFMSSLVVWKYSFQKFLRTVAWVWNPDGSRLSEGQLRLEFQSFGSHLDFGDRHVCIGLSMALPGDTIYWRWDERCRKATYTRPATDAELQARGWLQHGGLLVRMCAGYRERHNEEDSDGMEEEDSDMEEEDTAEAED